ncbi:MAG TPA: hypothetical protein VFX52_14205 [Nocardioidaceae bacterium]|jgi:hypothetical protein|nr:hypothetical protein [Nocardioidaceae bacterium]
MAQMYVDDDCRLRTRRAERHDKRERAERAAALAVRAATLSGTLLRGDVSGASRPPSRARR